MIGRVAGARVGWRRRGTGIPTSRRARDRDRPRRPARLVRHASTEAGILAKIGLNQRGVACALNFLSCSADGGLDGVPIHVLLRVLLRSAATAAEALALLLGAQVSASSCVTVAVGEAAGVALFAVELSPGGPAVAWPDDGGLLVHTNHFLRPPPRGQDTEPAMHPGTLLRRRHLGRMLRTGDGAGTRAGGALPGRRVGVPARRSAEPRGPTGARRCSPSSSTPAHPRCASPPGLPAAPPYRSVTLG